MFNDSKRGNIMMKGSNGQVLKIIIFLALNFFLMSMYKSAGYANNTNIEKELKYYKENIKHDMNPLSPVYNRILGYAALRGNDISICEENKACEDFFKNNFIFKKLADKQCNKIDSDVLGIVNMCNSLDNCSDVKDDLWRKVCSGLYSSDVYLLKSGLQGLEQKQGKSSDYPTDEFLRMIALYQGFKQNRSQKACETYVISPKGKYAYFCEVIFSPLPVNEVLDTVAEDLACFFLVIQTGDQTYCEYIKNQIVHEGCLSSEPMNYFNPHPSMVPPEEGSKDVDPPNDGCVTLDPISQLCILKEVVTI